MNLPATCLEKLVKLIQVNLFLAIFSYIWNHCASARAQVIDFWQLFFASSQKSQLIGAIHFRMAAIGGGSRLRLSAMKSYAHQSEILAKRPTMNFHVLLPLC